MSVIKYRSLQNLLIVFFSSFFISFVSYAKKQELLKEPLAQPTFVSSWQFEFAPRYWYSSGQYKETLLDNPRVLTSRLTYEDLDANSAEAFWRLEHHNGAFLKGYFGGGAISGGQLIDEDFPPGTTPYSNTVSPQKNGSLSYLSVDLGYGFFSAENWRLASFIGYHYWQEQVNNFGCQQMADGFICAPTIALSVDTLNNSAQWNSLRLGVNGQIHLNESWRLEADLAYIHSTLQEYDFHNLRPSIRGILDTGTGNGFQLDAIFKWLFTENLSFGAGGRWWYIATNGWAHFEQVADPGQPQPLDGVQSRYGLLIQADYKFLDRPQRSNNEDFSTEFNWAGVYLGANIGYSTNPNMVYLYPTSEITQLLQANNFSPYSLNLQNAGFLGGGQLGYNWQVKQIIWGIEGDLDYAQIGAANAVTNNLPLTTTLHQNIRWLSSLRGRIGKLATDNMLFYLTTGPAWGGITLGFDQRNVDVSCAENYVCLSTEKKSTQTGWTAGAGIEYAATPRITFKAEYLYVDLGYFRMNSAGYSILGPTSYLLNTNYRENTLRLGLNYKMHL